MIKTNGFKAKSLAIIIAALCTPTPSIVLADDVVEDIETIQVWGTTISNDSSLLQDDIEKKQADHLSDLLRDQAGIDIGGSHSMVQGINIRGVDELDLNITIDGISQNNNMFHHSGNLLINADILKAVEIQVGTNSVLTGGLSGGVAFETKDGKDLIDVDQKFGSRIHANYGSNDYLGGSVSLYGQVTDEIDALAYITYTDKANFDDGNGDVVEGNDGQISNGIIKFGYDVDEHNRFELAYDKYIDEGDYFIKTNLGSGYNTDSNASTQDIEYSRTSLSLSYQLDLGDAINLHTSIYRNELSYIPNNVEGNSVHIGYSALAQSIINTADIKHTLKYGAQGYKQTSRNITDGIETNEETAKSHALYLEDELALTDALFITPGIRYNHYSVNMHSPATNDALDKTWSEFTFGLSAKYLLNDSWTLTAGTTELFQGPGLRETYTEYQTTFDQNLKAETGLNTNLGLAYQKNNVLGLDRLGFSVNVFNTQIDDYIDNWSIGKGNRANPVGTYTNSGDYDIDGFESTLSLRKEQWSAKLTYSKSDSEHKETDESLRYEVGDSMSLNVNYDLAELDASLSWTSLFTLDDDSIYAGQDVHKESYNVHHISMQWFPENIEGLIINAGVENIFNEQYFSHASFTNNTIKDYEPGRNIKLSASYIF